MGTDHSYGGPPRVDVSAETLKLVGCAKVR